MLVNNIKPIPDAVEPLILARSHPVCFIHTDVDLPAGKALGRSGKHSIDQLVGLLLTDQQNIVAIIDAFVFRSPFEHFIEMRKGLDARNQLYADFCAVGIQLLQLRLGVSSSKMAKIGLAVHLIGILHIKLNLIIAHSRYYGDKFLELRYRHYSITRAVAHITKHFIGTRFMNLH